MQIQEQMEQTVALNPQKSIESDAIEVQRRLYDLSRDEELSTCTLRLKETRKPKLIFTDDKQRFFVSIWNCIVGGEDEEEDENRYKPEYRSEREGAEPMTLRLKDLIEGNQLWVVIIVHGGYFSGAVFLNGKPIVHKSTHRYV